MRPERRTSQTIQTLLHPPAKLNPLQRPIVALRPSTTFPVCVNTNLGTGIMVRYILRHLQPYTTDPRCILNHSKQSLDYNLVAVRMLVGS